MATPLSEQPTDCGTCRFFAEVRSERNDSVCAACDDQGLGPLRMLKNGTFRRTEPHKVARINPALDARSTQPLLSI